MVFLDPYQYLTVKLPVVDVYGGARGAVITETKRMAMPLSGINAFEIEAFCGDLFQAILSYLVAIWQKVCVPREPVIKYREEHTGDFYIDLRNQPGGFECAFADIDLVKLPKDADVFFGATDVYHLGWFAFVYESRTGFSFLNTPFLFATASNTGPRRGEMKFINFDKNRFYPVDASCNGFWCRLKPGVVATVTGWGHSQQVGTEFSDISDDGNGPVQTMQVDAEQNANYFIKP